MYTSVNELKKSVHWFRRLPIYKHATYYITIPVHFLFVILVLCTRSGAKFLNILGVAIFFLMAAHYQSFLTFVKWTYNSFLDQLIAFPGRLIISLGYLHWLARPPGLTVLHIVLAI